MAMYGTKAAAQNWQKGVTKTMTELGFKSGKPSPVIFAHEQREIRTLVQDDDFVSSGTPENLKWLKDKLEAKYEISTKVIREREDLGKSMKILNRTLKWIKGVGIQYEADPKHAEKIIKQTGAKDMKGLQVPIVREDCRETEEQKTKSTEEMKRRGKLDRKRREED